MNQQAEDLRRCCDALKRENQRMREVLRAFVDVYGKDDVRRWMEILDAAKMVLKGV